LSLDLQTRLVAAAGLLRAGGVVAYPTETFYALGALADRPDALARLAAAKGRAEGKPLPLIAADAEQVAAVASLGDPIARRLAERFWPGPLTLVLPAAAPLDPALCGPGPSVGIRVPAHDLARELARAAGGPLVSTSANWSGEPPASTASGISQVVLARIDGVLDGGPTPGGMPSTVVEVARGAVRLLRGGVMPWEEVRRAARG
jgi:L-threonylcarbamoyladenylate synthase